MPVAVKLVDKPYATVALVGLIAIAVNTGGVTVNVALLEMMPLVEALIFVVPIARLLALPVLLSVTTLGVSDDQITEPETLPALWSEYVPSAEYVTATPLGVDCVAGLMVMAVITAAVT